ncbi:MAG: hypothetical protein K5765_05735 [Clostridia bacterium]|nr:hypothetical protein [Clostridia bacterium]
MKNKESKFETILKNNKQNIVFGFIMFIITILLCIPQTLFALVGIFGWVIFAYYCITMTIFVLHLLNKTIYLKPIYIVFLLIGFFSIIATLHIACFNKADITNYTKYIINAYTEHNSVGGIIFSLITCLFVVPIGNIWGIVIFIVLAAIFLFLFIKPIVFDNKKIIDEKYKEKHKIEEKVYKEIILDESPFLRPEVTKERQSVILSDSYMEKTRISLNGNDNKEEYKSQLVLDKKSYSVISGSDILQINQKNEEKENKMSKEKAEEFFFGQKAEVAENVDIKELNFDDISQDTKIFEEEKDSNIYDMIYSTNLINKEEAQKGVQPIKEEEINGDEEKYKYWEKLNTKSEPTEEAENKIEEESNIEEEQTSEETNVIGIDYNDLSNIIPTNNSSETTETEEINEEYIMGNGENTQISDDISSALNGINKLIEEKQTIIQEGSIDEEITEEEIQDEENNEEIIQEEIINDAENEEKVEESIQEEPIKEEIAKEQTPSLTKEEKEIVTNTANINEEEQKEEEKHDILSVLWTDKNSKYKRPPEDILQDHFNPRYSKEIENSDRIKDILEERAKKLKIDCTVVDMYKGPSVTTVVLNLSYDCSIKNIYTSQKDLQRWLESVKEPNIIDQVEGTQYCALEIPNKEIETVSFKEVYQSREYREKKGGIVCAVGKTAQGKIYLEDIEEMPHALIAGATGNGKSVTMNDLLMSIIMRYSPEEVKFILIDMKLVEMEPYAGLPHMIFNKALSEEAEIVNALRWAEWEVKRRYALFKERKIHKISEYNALPDVKKLSKIIIVIDEASELMESKMVGKDVEASLSSLARVARAAGVHLLFATQNPTKAVIKGDIQNNMPTKIALGVADTSASMIVLKEKGAENLFCKGDMIIKHGASRVRVQAALITAPEINAAVDYIKANNKYDFDEYMINKILSGEFLKQIEEEKEKSNKKSISSSSSSISGSGVGDLVTNKEDDSKEPSEEMKALKVIIDNNNYVSISFLQRKLRKGYNSAANLVESLVNNGYLSDKAPGSKEKYKVLISREDFYKLWQEKYGDADIENIDDINDDDIDN